MLDSYIKIDDIKKLLDETVSINGLIKKSDFQKAITMIEEFRKPEIKPKNRIKNRLHLISMIDSYKKNILDKKVKILVYTDSVGCTACKLNLYDWKLRIDSLHDNPDLSFIFFVHAQHTNQFSNRLRGEAFNYPIFFDEKNIIEKLNHFPKDYRLQTFLLDSNNHVVLIGNPLGNESMWNLYKEEIKKLTKTKISNDET